MEIYLEENLLGISDWLGEGDSGKREGRISNDS